MLSTLTYPNAILASIAHSHHSRAYCDWLQENLEAPVKGDAYPALTFPPELEGLDYGTDTTDTRLSLSDEYQPAPEGADSHTSEVLNAAGRYRLATLGQGEPESVTISEVLHPLAYRSMLYVIGIMQDWQLQPQAWMSEVMMLTRGQLEDLTTRAVISKLMPHRTSGDAMFSALVGLADDNRKSIRDPARKLIETLANRAFPLMWGGEAKAHSLPGSDFEILRGSMVGTFDTPQPRHGYAVRYSLLVELGLHTLMTSAPHLLHMANAGILPRVVGVRDIPLHTSGGVVPLCDLMSGEYGLSASSVVPGLQSLGSVPFPDFLSGVMALSLTVGSFEVPLRQVGGAVFAPDTSTLPYAVAVVVDKLAAGLPSYTSLRSLSGLAVVNALRTLTRENRDNYKQLASGESYIGRLQSNRQRWPRRTHCYDHIGMYATHTAVTTAMWLGAAGEPERYHLTWGDTLTSVRKPIVPKSPLSDTPPVINVNFLAAFVMMQPIFGTDRWAAALPPPSLATPTTGYQGLVSTGAATTRHQAVLLRSLATTSIVQTRYGSHPNSTIHAVEAYIRKGDGAKVLGSRLSHAAHLATSNLDTRFRLSPPMVGFYDTALPDTPNAVATIVGFVAGGAASVVISHAAGTSWSQLSAGRQSLAVMVWQDVVATLMQRGEFCYPEGLLLEVLNSDPSVPDIVRSNLLVNS